MSMKTWVGKFEVELADGNDKDVWESLARLEEVFGHTKCGKCGGEELHHIVREVDDNKYYELRCTKCGAKLKFGQHKKGGSLFPKITEDGKYLPDGGWVRYNKDTGKEE